MAWARGEQGVLVGESLGRGRQEGPEETRVSWARAVTVRGLGVEVRDPGGLWAGWGAMVQVDTFLGHVSRKHAMIEVTGRPDFHPFVPRPTAF